MKTRLWLLALINLTVLLLLSLSCLGQLRDMAENTRRELEQVSRGSRINHAMQLANLHFKVQVQDWKDVLLRGNNPADYQRYLAAFEAERAIVEQTLAQASTALRDDGESSAAIDAVRDEHLRLTVRYRAALAAFRQEDPLSGQTVDKLVRGMDRAMTDQLLRQSAQVQDGFEKMLADRIAEADRGYRQTLNLFITVAALSLLLLAGSIGHIGRGLFRQVGGEPAAVAEIARRVAGGDLTARPALRDGDDRSVLAAMQHMVSRLTGVIEQLRLDAEQLNATSSEVAASAQALSQNASQQAASLEETSASVEEIAATVTQNSESARLTDAMARQAAQSAGGGAKRRRRRRGRDPHRGGDTRHFQPDRRDRRHRLPDQSAGAERRRRGRPCRQPRQRLHRGGRPGAQIGRTQPGGGAGNRLAGRLQRGHGGTGRRGAGRNAARHPQNRQPGAGDRAGLA